MRPLNAERGIPGISGHTPLKKSDLLGGEISRLPNNPASLARQANTQAFISPVWCGGRDGYAFTVTLRGGELLCSRSRDPEHDAARALRERGLAGFLTLVDADSGRARSIVCIDRAAGRMTSEESRGGLRFRKRPEHTDNSPYSRGRGAP